MNEAAFISDLDIIGDLAMPGAGWGGLSGLNDVDIIGDGATDTAVVLEALQNAGIPPAQAAGIAQSMSKARKIDPAAVMVRQQVLKRLGYQAAGIPATTFPTATPTQTINVTVTRPFKPYEPVFPSSLADFFVINSATINGINQFASANPVPLSSFSEGAQRSKIRWDTINPSSPLVLNVTMIETSVQRILYGQFIGAALMK